MCTQKEPIVFGSYLWVGTRWFLAIGSGINDSVDEDIGLPGSPANHINNHQNKQHHDSLFSLSCNSGLLCNCESIDLFSPTPKRFGKCTWEVWELSDGLFEFVVEANKAGDHDEGRNPDGQSH